jgi:hypothetical protein
MPSTLHDSTVAADRLNSVGRARPAKVHAVAHSESAITEHRNWIGRCLARALKLADLSVDDAAEVLGCHPSQLSKWIRNAEPPQTDRVLMSPMRPFMLQAMAERTPGCAVQTVITVTRIA